jgi:lipopolysaccharide transport system ATP-binding protein
MDVEALVDVSFDVEEGEVFGIIGRNGAGKSTLLKILSRITSPSAGRAMIRGSVASLLEVGTGFHPDLTGRENVYLNGMLLGMPARAVDKAYDAICEFAGIGPYIDTPIKRYSSGMQLRLAFAVAAHLAADTMIVDEVLAVGDAEFQAKCTRTMREAAGRGRTTLFVSHNMAAVENLCTRVMWLERGRVMRIGAADEIVREYLSGATASTGHVSEYVARPLSIRLPVRIAHAEIAGPHGTVIAQGDDLLVSARLEVTESVRGLHFCVGVSTVEGTQLCMLANRDYQKVWDLQPGAYDVAVRITSVRLLPRVHTLTLRTATGYGADVCEHLQDVLSFPVLERDVLGAGVPLLADRGVTWFPADFQVRATNA